MRVQAPERFWKKGESNAPRVLRVVLDAKRESPLSQNSVFSELHIHGVEQNMTRLLVSHTHFLSIGASAKAT